MTRPQDKTVLVVDDEPNVRQYLAQILLDAGFNVVQAGDGSAAMEIIQGEPSGLHLPGPGHAPEERSQAPL